MKTLVFLVAVSYCSAQLVLPYGAPWVLPQAKLITADSEELKTVLPYSPFLHHPFAYSPFLHHPLAYSVVDSGLEATEFPFIYKAAAAAAEEEPAVEEARRRKREATEAVSVPLPYLHAVPATAKATIETKQFEGVEAAVPASTKLIELTTKEHEIDVPAIKYVQPVVNYKPITYTTHSIAPLAYHGLPLGYSNLPLAYSGLGFHGFHGLPLLKVAEAAEE